MKPAAILPAPVRRVARRLRNPARLIARNLRDPVGRIAGIAERFGLLRSARNDLTPPRWMFLDPDRVDGSRNLQEFISIGEKTAAWFIREGLESTDRVLDVGSGLGRVALPLTRHLENGGTYDGIEIAKYKVDYCTRTLGQRFANFRFHHADVFNKYYNPRGRARACEYAFPFPDSSFDFVFLVSVFTHMLPADMEHYVAEIFRVMDKGATSIATFWLMESKKDRPEDHDYSDVCTVYRIDEPEHGVHYIESHVLDVYTRTGFEIQRVERFPRGPSGKNIRQDIIVARKPA
jgi:SAM-dependent methyltransferase